MIDELLKLANSKNIKIEVFVDEDITTSIETMNDKLEKYESSSTNSYRIKALYNNKIVTINTEDISSPETIINNIIDFTNALDKEEDTTFACNIDIRNNSKEKEDKDYKKIINDLISLNKYKEKYPNIENINMYYTDKYNKISIVNKDVELIDTSNINYIYGEIVWKEEGINQTGWFNLISLKYDFSKIEEKFIETIKDVEAKIKAVSCKTNKYNVIIKNEQVFKILNRYKDMYDAEQIRNNLSPLTKDYNKKIFSDKITIVEDPTNNNLVGTRLFDMEGNATYYKELVKDGKFITKLYDNKNAIIEEKKPTGTSGGVRNMYIVPGSDSYEDLIKKMNNGIIIDSLEGLHAGANVITGELSLQATGYEVINGKISKSLKLIIMQTALKELFNNVICVGNDLEMFSVTGGSPSILFNNITIVGKE